MDDDVLVDVDDVETLMTGDQRATAKSIWVPRYQLDRLSPLSTVVRLAFMDVVAAGTLPFVSTLDVDGAVDPSTLLPAGAVTERSVCHDAGLVALGSSRPGAVPPRLLGNGRIDSRCRVHSGSR